MENLSVLFGLIGDEVIRLPSGEVVRKDFQFFLV